MTKHPFTFLLGAVALIICLSVSALAQNKTFDNVLSIRLRNMRPIISGNEVTGYYMFYKMDKADRKNNIYLLRILDANLNEVASEQITESKNIQLTEATFNEDALMMKFVDLSQKVAKIYIFDNAGKLRATKTLTLNKYDAAAYGVNTEEIESQSLVAAPNQGFFNYSVVKNKDYGYEITSFSSLGEPRWTYKSNAESKEVESPDFLTVGQNILFNIVTKRASMSQSDYSSYLSGIDMKSGKKLFEKSLVDDKFTYQIFSGYENPDAGNVVLFGLFFEKDANMTKEQSLGLFMGSVDNEGNFITKSYSFWAKEVSKYLPINTKGKIDKLGYMYFHRVFNTADKKIYAIGETYKKVTSGAGVAMRMLSRNSNVSTAQINVEDMLIFEFNPDFSLSNLKVFDKTKTEILLPAGFGLMSPQRISHYIRAVGGFDYSFTQLSQDKTNFIVGYTDVDKEEKKRRLNFEAIIHADNKFSTDKLSLQTEASSLQILPAKPGYLMVIEYFRKAKKLSMRVEKVNY